MTLVEEVLKAKTVVLIGIGLLLIYIVISIYYDITGKSKAQKDLSYFNEQTCSKIIF
jgi:hypothetical protein